MKFFALAIAVVLIVGVVWTAWNLKPVRDEIDKSGLPASIEQVKKDAAKAAEGIEDKAKAEARKAKEAGVAGVNAAATAWAGATPTPTPAPK